MKRLTALLLTALLLTGCSLHPLPQQKQYNATFLDVFDTVTTIVGRAESQEAFQSISQSIHDDLLFYHQLFDIYNSYEGLNNLKTINDQAGLSPVEVDSQIIALLKDCKAYYTATGGTVNAAMGAVLMLWHKARSQGIDDPSNAYLPDEKALAEASQHTKIDAIVIDEAASTVYISDSRVSLDVGAIAKGWATQRVCENAPKGLLLSVGGNVCATGPKAENTPWVVGIQNPDGGSEYLHTVYLSQGSVVTSGDYQRAYRVDGTLYHHIIDPSTLYPGRLWRAVTVVCPDSGLADALSTALFLLPQQEGQALLSRYQAEAMWVAPDGSLLYSPGFQALIRT